jgi:drug/metabolite transporter (DMT)-like permease
VRWTWLAISVVFGTFGDLLTAKGMSEHGIDDFGVGGLKGVLRHIGTHPLVVLGIVFDAFSFFSLMALLSVSEISFAVPASASSYIVKTALAGWFLGERVTLRRWWGAICVTAGIVLISL